MNKCPTVMCLATPLPPKTTTAKQHTQPTRQKQNKTKKSKTTTTKDKQTHVHTMSHTLVAHNLPLLAAVVNQPPFLTSVPQLVTSGTSYCTSRLPSKASPRWQVTAKTRIHLTYVAFIEPCFGIGHSLSLICQMTSEDIKHQFIIIISGRTLHGSPRLPTCALPRVSARGGYAIQPGKLTTSVSSRPDQLWPTRDVPQAHGSCGWECGPTSSFTRRRTSGRCRCRLAVV